MKGGWLLVALLAAHGLSAQLRVDEAAPAAPRLSWGVLPISGVGAEPYVPYFGATRRVAPSHWATGRAPATFDFRRTQPHLAFFCRLEINEARGAAVPLKFRLGGHRPWQENLLR